MSEGKTSQDDEMSLGAQAFIDDVRDLDSPSPADRDRVKRALVATLASGAGLAAATAGTSTAAATAAGTGTAAGTVAGTAAVGAAAGFSVGAKLVAALVVAVAIGGTALVVSRSDEVDPGPAPAASARHFSEPEPLRATVTSSEAPHEIAELPGLEALEVTEVAEPQTEVEPELEVEAPVAVAPVPSRHRPATRRETAVADSTLTAEIALIRDAQRALRADQPELALRHLDAHASRFADGVLSEEREAARVVALCEAGRVDASRALAQRFMRERPSSPHRARVLGACADP